jgi:hypothetical protein
MPIRTATCMCRQLSVACEGEPDRVSLCFCTECQRRSGAPFGAGAYFLRERVKVQGAAKTFTRTAETGRPLHMRFCPECGTTVYWELDMRPQHFGVALGGFNDPSFAKPHAVIFVDNKPDWMPLPEGIPSFPRAQSA